MVEKCQDGNWDGTGEACEEAMARFRIDGPRHFLQGLKYSCRRRAPLGRSSVSTRRVSELDRSKRPGSVDPHHRSEGAPTGAERCVSPEQRQ